MQFYSQIYPGVKYLESYTDYERKNINNFELFQSFDNNNIISLF